MTRGGEERRIRDQIAKEVVAGLQEQASGDDEKDDVRDQLSKASFEVGCDHRLQMKNRRKVGKKGVGWQYSGM